MKILFFDTETTGVPEKDARWEEDYQNFPHIVEIAWNLGRKSESHIIAPVGWEIPKEATEIHGISQELAMAEGEPFELVIDTFIVDCLKADYICAHSIYFDTSIIKANILRSLGVDAFGYMQVNEALDKDKRIDTMRSTMKWVDARTPTGRLKFPRLEELFSRCFPTETFNAHCAMEDVRALVKCFPVLMENNLISFKKKETQTEASETPKADIPESTPENPEINNLLSEDNF